MPRATAAVRPRVLSGATALVFGGGLALYQMTSLVLGPPAARQLNLSLTIPVAEPTERAEPAAANASFVIGAVAPLLRLPSGAGRSATPSHRPAMSTPAVASASLQGPTVVKASPAPSAAPRPAAEAPAHVPPTPPAPLEEEPD